MSDSTKTEPDATSQTKVFYDGSCALCRAEIGHYQRRDDGGALVFVDVSEPGTKLPDGVTRSGAMARFHVETGDGHLVSGAEAFAHVWSCLPRWQWAAKVAAKPGVLRVLEGSYRLFLPVRPLLSAAFRVLSRRAKRR